MQTTLEHMSVWGLISEASLVVQAVMVILVLASVSSWYLIIRRSAALHRSERLLRSFQQRFRQGGDLAQLYREGQQQPLPEEAALQRIFLAGYGEFANFSVKRASPRMRSPRAWAQPVRRHCRAGGTPGEGPAVPRHGGFGEPLHRPVRHRVGIMNSFLGLSQVQQATLSTVAPGIAEALIATAIGLFAAIPAVMAYNRFAAHGQTLVGRYYAFGNELQARLNRRLHAASPSVAAAA